MVMSNTASKEGVMDKTIKGIKECAKWLEACLALGFSKSKLDELEELYWQYHDGNGDVIDLKESTDEPS